MATTSDMAPGRRKSGSEKAADAVADQIGDARGEQLEAQISALQSDLKAIAATLAKIGGEKVEEVRAVAHGEIRQLRNQGENALIDAQDQAYALERQLKDTIRERPLTAVASALGIGYILALLTRG